MWSPDAPFSRDEWDWLQRTLDTTYADFTGKVAAGRGLTQEEVLAVAKGQIWSGSDAKEAGLVDELGGYLKAIDIAKEVSGISSDTVVELRDFPEPRDPFATFLDFASGGEIDSPALQSLLVALARLAQAVAPLAEVLERLGDDPRSQTLRAPYLAPAELQVTLRR